MKKYKSMSLLLSAAFSLILLTSQQTTAQQKSAPKVKIATSAGTKNVAGKIGQFIEKGGGKYTKFSDTVWTVAYQGTSLKNFDVMVGTLPDTELFVMSVTIAKKKDIRLTQDLLYKLLQYNDMADYVKSGFDEEGNLFLRADLNGRLIDLQEFNAVIEQLAAASDDLHKQIKAWVP